MKVLTIKQPFATLIALGLKEYEFRTWNTKYRGDILIHAGKGIDKKAMKKYAHLNLDYPIGCIIAKATITDSIFVDDKFKEVLKNKNAFIYNNIIKADSNYIEYGFKLENIEEIDKIYLNGQLSFWNYYKPNEIMGFVDNIEYGFIGIDKKKYINMDSDSSTKYCLSSPKEVIDEKLGICLDQVELERYYFKNSGYKINTYFIVHYDNCKCPAHTFLVYEIEDKFFWFEHSWTIFKGIWEYKSIEELLKDVKEKFIKYELNDIYSENNLHIRLYKKPKYNISISEFYTHCETGESIKIK